MRFAFFVILSWLGCGRSLPYDIIDTKLVVMDEIEFPIMNNDISVFQKNISFLASVHPENAFGSFYQSFETANFKPYRPHVKRKEC